MFPVVLVAIISALLYNDIVHIKAQMETIVVKKISKGTDYRYKSIDNEFALSHEILTLGSDGRIIKCFKTIDAEIRAYYKDYNMTITPFGRLLLKDYKCKDD